MIRIATAPVSPRRAYRYDTLGRPTSRTLARQGATRNDVFNYNDRSELISDVVDDTDLNGWDYDNIGNRRMEQRMDGYEIYTANQLNQYTAIEDESHEVFTPTYDDDGNQTRIKTSTGIWNVTYNAKNRPVLFTKDDNSVSVACTYDYMGRRATKVVTENGVITTSHRFLYRGYLQVACCDRTRANHPCIWLITWDPTQPIATCPLAIQKDSTWYTYGWDLTKNIWEAYTSSGYIGTAYTYTAYGQVTASGSITQPIQWSSEYNDTELALVYYNYRHYNPVDGRWAGRDMWSSTKDDYKVVDNEIIFTCDALGLLTIGIDGTNYDTKHHPEQRSNVTRFLDAVNDQTLYYGGPGSRDTSTGFSDILGTSYSSEEVGFGQIRDMVYTDICSIYRNDPNIEINLVGWSRGAVIAVEIAELLNEKGCCNGTRRRLIRSMNPFEGWKWECVCTYKRGIKVNFIGLFDPVDMSFFNSNTSIKPDNVTSLFSIQSDSRSVKEQVFFQPQEYEGEERKKVKRNNDGSRTKHGDIGGTEDSRENNALALMKEKAGQAGVKFK